MENELAATDQTQAPRLYAPLPGRTADTTELYERRLTEMIDALGVEQPQLAADDRRSRYEWQHRARRVIGQGVQGLPVSEGWFEPLMRAVVYDPNPSFNRQLIEPSLAVFGRRRVQLALLDYLKTGADPERAGAARAWHWTQVLSTRRAGSRTTDNKDEDDAFADLNREWRDAALRVFLDNDDLDVRRCVLPHLDLRAREHPDESRLMVREAIRIARTHPDEYIRHRVEHQA